MSRDRPDASAPWRRIERALGAALPALAGALAPPATRADLDALVQRTGLDLAPSLAALYGGHDGQQVPVPGLFVGFHFLSAREAGDEWHRWCALLRDDPALAASLEATAQPEGMVEPVYASPAWLPFAADGAGNHLAIDGAPGPAGTRGQVVSFGPDEAVRYRLAPSVDAFLSWFADALETGRVAPAPDPDAPGGLALRVDGVAHLLDALPELMGARGLG